MNHSPVWQASEVTDGNDCWLSLEELGGGLCVSFAPHRGGPVHTLETEEAETLSRAEKEESADGISPLKICTSAQARITFRMQRTDGATTERRPAEVPNLLASATLA